MNAPRVDQPVAGHYAIKLVRGGHRVACRIWFGQPVIDGEVQDRSPRWCVEIDGRTDRFDKEQGCRVPLELERAWPFCAKDPITVAEYRHLLRRAEWAREHAPEHPAANPRKQVDFHAIKPPF